MTPFTEAEQEAGRLLFAREAEFIIGAAELQQLPEGDRLEICFAGRSNVGKSSLINALTGRKNLARASNTPGRTQQLNYFALNHPDIAKLYMVDLPGYGYAKAPKSEVERWQGVLRGYLSGRASLRRCFLLIDSRHGIKAVDQEIMEMLDVAAVSYQIVLTKADKIKAAAMDKVIEETARAIAKRPAAYPQMIVTSAEQQEGIGDLRAAVARLAAESG
jgi:GTP-binding protein